MPTWVGFVIFVLCALIVAGLVAIFRTTARPSLGAFLARRPHAVPAAIAAALLLVAVLELPYGFYTFLRLGVTAAAVYVAYSAYEWGKTWALWSFAVVALLFNPLVPVHLSKSAWMPIDLATSACFFVSAVVLKEDTKQS